MSTSDPPEAAAARDELEQQGVLAARYGDEDEAPRDDADRAGP
jgi:hypothetical protein